MEEYREGSAAGLLEVDGICAAFAALDAAAKAADVVIESVERTRLNCFVCVKIRGSIPDVEAAMEAGKNAAREIAALGACTIITAPSDDTEKMLRITNI